MGTRVRLESLEVRVCREVLINLLGDLQSAYILRNLNSTDFRYDPGKEKLLGLSLETPGHQSILYTSVVDDVVDDTDGLGGQENSRQGRLMRLGTSINLDSRLTVILHCLASSPLIMILTNGR